MLLNGRPTDGRPALSYVGTPEGSLVGNSGRPPGHLINTPGQAGPQGPPGPEGPQGPQGPAGLDATGVLAVNTPSNVSGTVTLDFASKSKYIGAITLGANVTTLAFSNLPGAGNYAEYELHIKQDPATPRTFALPASHKALGGSDTAIAAGVGVTTVLTASTIDNGTTWRYAMQESA